MTFPKQPSKPNFFELQQVVSAYWKNNHLFEKSVENRSPDKSYRFYDGPPFITGVPHYGTLLSSIIKDVIPRYQTMRGHRVERVFGWDCHGIPIEQKVMSKHGIAINRDIEEKIGIETFINECYDYTKANTESRAWYIDNIGRWVEFEKSYKTQDNDYMESVWWVFKQLREKGYVYKGKKVFMYSTKLATPISNFEVAMDDTYGDVNDPAITVKFKLSDRLTFKPKETDASIIDVSKFLLSLPEGYTIEYGQAKDAADIYNTFYKSWSETYVVEGGITQEDVDHKYEGRINLTSEEASARFEKRTNKLLVVKLNGTVIGVNALPTYDESGKPEIQGLYLLNEHQGKGLAKALMVINESLSSENEMYVKVADFNQKAIDFYKSMGYEVIEGESEQMNFPSGSVIREVVMRKDLSNLANSDALAAHPQNDESKSVPTELENVYVLAWTTTPWTIPANLALAVNRTMTYDIVKMDGDETSYYITASTRTEHIFKNKPHQIISQLSGAELEGKAYSAPFMYYEGYSPLDHHIYHADWVSDSDGTGIVHCAPEFGESDYQLGQSVGLTMTEALDKEGNYTAQVEGHDNEDDFNLVGKYYRDCNDQIIEELKKLGRLFDKASITHRVAFCPRTNVPLIYKAIDSWMIDIKKLKPKLLERNQDINWYPEHFKNGRFANSIESAPDWNISRSRYRGTPMPIYAAEGSTDDFMIIGSREELYELCKSGSNATTKVLLVRHGESENNKKSENARQTKTEFKYDSRINDNPLTEKGLEQANGLVEKLAGELQNRDDIVFYVSPILRAQQTIAPYLEKYLNIKLLEHPEIQKIKSALDVHTGNGTEDLQWIKNYKIQDNIYSDYRIMELHMLVGGGVTYENYENEGFDARVKDFMQEATKLHQGKTVVIVGHSHLNCKILEISNPNKAAPTYVPNGTINTVYRDTVANKELDMHRPWIDNHWFVKDGKTYKRINDVFDCWMESASMPYAQLHYPFENKEKFDNNFPGDFVVEYTGQIRAWFYVMHVIGVALFDKAPFKHVLTTGVLAGNDGRKMSKSYGNFVDPQEVIPQFGGEAIRMILANSPVSYGGDTALKDEYFLDMTKRFMLPVWNSFSFLTTYANLDNRTPNPELVAAIKADDWSKVTNDSTNILDRWIITLCKKLLDDVSKGLEEYSLVDASGSLISFVDNLTNWYIRRSRRRFWKSEHDGDKNSAYQTLYIVMILFCKAAAPFVPFIADYIYKTLVDGMDTSTDHSIHLTNWPDLSHIALDQSLLDSVSITQAIVSGGLSARAQQNVRVRQPLATLTIDRQLSDEAINDIKDELNIKNVVTDPSIATLVTQIIKVNAKLVGAKLGGRVQEIIKKGKEGQFVLQADGTAQIDDVLLQANEFEINYLTGDRTDIFVTDGIVYSIDMTITPELEIEGLARDLIRSIQEQRKEAGYELSDRIKISLSGADNIIAAHREMIQDETLSTITELVDGDLTKEYEIGGNTVAVMVLR